MSHIDGVLNIDKPDGLSSHDVVNRIRRLTGIRKVGHTGTLDPLATGVLVICVGRATRLAEYVSGQPKNYLANILLGQETDTYDQEGRIIAQNPVSVTKAELEAALLQFHGEIQQIPPMYSAIKVEGQPLYKHARKGEVFDLKARTVHIECLEILHWQTPHLGLHIECSSGTYIRSIAHDLGQILGCGGVLSSLRRTAVGRFQIDDAAPLNLLREDNWQTYLLKSEVAVSHLKKVEFESDAAMALYYGQKIPAMPDQESGHLHRAFDENGQFIGILTVDEGLWRPKKIFYLPLEG
jgi:tRNA pseudouridine55 synthase